MKRLIVVLGIMVAFIFSMSASVVFAQTLCEGNFDCDGDVDGTDAAVFKSDFGRSQFNDPCPTCPPRAPVPKTGQTTSYATGDDGDLEKGVTWPNPRFTDNGDGTITDELTGLIWLKDANCFGPRTWNNALSDSNGLADGTCGLTDGSNAGDWRLPNINELYSLVHKGYCDPSVPDTAGTGQWSEGDPFTDVRSSDYWSSSTVECNTGYARYVTMYEGYEILYIKSGNLYVWPVRDGD